MSTWLTPIAVAGRCDVWSHGSRHALLVAHLSRLDAAEAQGVLPGAVSLAMGTYGSQVGGHILSADEIPLQNWWRQDFRRSLYYSFPTLTDPPDLQSMRDGAWSGDEYLRVAGVGLLRFIREDLGLALALAQAIERMNVDSLHVLVDSRLGLRLGQVVRETAEIFGLPCKISYRRPEGRTFRLPAWGLAAIQNDRVSPAWARSWIPGVWQRTVHRDRAIGTNGRAQVAFFEPNERGWRYARSVIKELIARGVEVAAIAPRGSDIGQVEQLAGSSLRTVRSQLPPSSLRGDVVRALAGMPIDLRFDLGTAARSAEMVLRRVVARRLRAYLPGMIAASEAARKAISVLGVRTTFQFGHISPAGRAFMAQAQSLGAETFTMPEGLPYADAPEHGFAIPPDGVLAWGRSENASYERARRIHVVGNDLIQANIERVRGALPASRARSSMVLVAFGRPGRIVSPQFFASAVEMVAWVSRATIGWDFVANIHPGDTVDFWRAVLRRSGMTSSIRLTSRRIYEMMGRAFVVVTTHSTAGAEAIVSGLPVVCIGSHTNPRNQRWYETDVIPDYVSEGAAYVAATWEGLAAHLNHLRKSSMGADRLAERRAAYSQRFLHVAGSSEAAVSRMADVLMSSAARMERKVP